MRHISFDRFEVVVKSGSVVRSVQLERRNLVAWKIVFLRLDLSNINATHLDTLSDKSQEYRDETNKRITYTSGSGDGIIEINPASSSYFYYCMDLDCTSTEPICGGTVVFISPDSVTTGGYFYCKGDLPDRSRLWKCTRHGYRPL